MGLLDGIYNSAVQDETSVKNIDLIIDSENERQHSLRESPTSRNIFGQEVPPFTGDDILSLVMGVSGGPVNMAKSVNKIAKGTGQMVKQISSGKEGGRVLDHVLSKYGTKPHAQLRKLIEENKAVSLDLPERGDVLQRAINRIVKKIEKNPKKQKRIIDLIFQEDWEDFTGMLAGRTMKYLKQQ